MSQSNGDVWLHIEKALAAESSGCQGFFYLDLFWMNRFISQPAIYINTLFMRTKKLKTLHQVARSQNYKSQDNQPESQTGDDRDGDQFT